MLAWHQAQLHVSVHRSAFRQVIPFLDCTSQLALQTGSAEDTSQRMHVAASLTIAALQLCSSLMSLGFPSAHAYTLRCFSTATRSL